jgi:hypothetical protein
MVPIVNPTAMPLKRRAGGKTSEKYAGNTA